MLPSDGELEIQLNLFYWFHKYESRRFWYSNLLFSEKGKRRRIELLHVLSNEISRQREL